MQFRAIVLNNEHGTFDAQVATMDRAELDRCPHAHGDVVIRVAYSTINYKDGLALTNRSPVVRRWPMVPGIDLAGTVESSEHSAWTVGDEVILNGWGAGENHWGGLAEYARMPSAWLLRRPETLSAARTMAIGTAGYTAMLCCLALVDHAVTPDRGEVLVTGASGGVGSIAISLLAQRGYRVVASTGKPGGIDMLKRLGAAEVIDRASLSGPGKPLQKERWAGVIDAVGSHTLANACAQMQYGGVVAACGLAQGMDFPASVAPFILRGVKLIGIDSVMCPIERRRHAWERLAAEIDLRKLDSITHTIGLSASFAAANSIVNGAASGRTVVDVTA